MKKKASKKKTSVKKKSLNNPSKRQPERNRKSQSLSNKKTANDKRKSKVGKKSSRGKKRKRKKMPLVKQIILELIAAIILAVSLLWLLALFTFTFAKVDGYGMLPSLSAKDTVFVSKLSEKRRFDLVYIKLPNGKGTSVRRIIALPGDQVKYDKDQLFINSEMREEKFIAKEVQQADIDGSFYTKDFTLNQQFNEAVIPKGKYLVLGDNRPYSTDSRYYGLLDEKNIIGIVKMRVFPLHKMEKY